jgi:hypothetical protein
MSTYTGCFSGELKMVSKIKLMQSDGRDQGELSKED